MPLKTTLGRTLWRLFAVAIILMFGLGLLALAAHDPGYVVLSRAPYVVRLPLLLLILLVLFAFAMLHFAINIIIGLVRAPQRYRLWQSLQLARRRQVQTAIGYAGLIEGNWARAEEALKKDLAQQPLLNALGLAYAAQQQGDLARRNTYLSDALSRHPAHRLAIMLTRARLHYQAGELSLARDCLETVRPSAPRQAPLLQLLCAVYRQQQDWSALIRILPTLKSVGALTADEVQEQEQLAYTQLLASPRALADGAPGEAKAEVATQSVTDLATIAWAKFPSHQQKDPVLVGNYAAQLLAQSRHKDAEAILRKALNRQYHAELIYLYGKVQSPFMDYQIQLAESFVKKHGDDADLLLTLARLYRYQHQYDRARNYYKQATAVGVRDEIYIDYGSLLEQLGETDAALFFYKKAVATFAPEAATHATHADNASSSSPAAEQPRAMPMMM